MLFIHIPKCGGTTVAEVMQANQWHISFHDEGLDNSLNPFCKCPPQHLEFRQLSQIFDVDKLHGRIVTIVRHPTERIISAYKWRVMYQGLTVEVNRWICDAIDAWHKRHYVFDNHITPQHYYVGKGVRFFKLENGLNRFFSFISSEFKEEIVYNDVNLMSTKDIDVQLTAETKVRINEFYARDFEIFKYT